MYAAFKRMIMQHDEQWLKQIYDGICEKQMDGYAFLTLKIKRFRTVNRVYGRGRGDELLTIVYNAIASVLQPDEYLAMTSVNYYNILIKYTDDDSLIQRIFGIFIAIRDMPDKRFQSKVFSGLGAYKLTAPFVDYYTAQYNADLCRTESQHVKYRNSHLEVYGVTYQDPNEHFLDPEDKIHEALEKGHIKLYLQPKVDLKTGKVASAEALVRWIDPEKGMIPVKDFLPSLDATGLIRFVDLYLFEEVCKCVDRWYHQFGKEIQISVNLAECSFNYNKFFNDYRAIFERYHAPLTCIEIELLESIILNQVDQVNRVVTQVRDYGFSCALDDFGSGFSSYNVLTNAGINTVKIDRSLFLDESNEREKIVIKHIIASAHELDMLTVAEGVESPSYAAYLRDLGCDFIQGYVYYKPMPAHEFEERFVQGNESISMP